MDTRSDSGPTPEEPGGAPAAGFFAWIRGLGIVRGGDRWFAGVAGGIAARAGIDPIIIRGLFVVLALVGGAAVLLYVIGWLLLPDQQGRIHLEELFRGRAQTGVIVAAAIIAAVVIIPVVLGIGTPVSVFSWDLWSAVGIPEWISVTAAWLTWGAIIVLGVLWLRRLLLQRGREQREAAAAPGTGTGAGAGSDAAGAADGSQPSPAPADAGWGYAAASAGPTAFAAPVPPPPADGPGRPNSAGDPDPGAAPAGTFSERVSASADRAADQTAEWGRKAGEKAEEWAEQATRKTDEWSARYAEQHDATRLGAFHTIFSIALALIAAGAVAAWSLGPLGLDPLVPALIAALAVLALSLIAAGIRGKRTGWVGFLAACGVVALLFTSVLPAGTRFQAFGDLASAGEEPGLAVLAGNVTLDLRDRAAAPAGEPVTTWLLAGNTTVLLPEEAPTVVEVRVLAGRVEEQGAGREIQRLAGPLIGRTMTSNLPDDATREERADAARVTVYALAGNVTVTHEGGADAGSGSGTRSRAADDPGTDAREIAALEERIDRLDWQLEEPGLTRVERNALEDEQDALQTELEELETEGSR